MKRIAFIPALAVAVAAVPQNDRPAGAAWALGRDGIVEIPLPDAADGTPRSVSGAVVLHDGTLLVADAAKRTILVHGPAGEPLRTLGEQGNGPGAFASLGWIGSRDGRHVLAWDAQLSRLTTFDASGAVVDVTQLAGVEGSFPTAVGLLDDGSFALETGVDILAIRLSRGARRDTVSVVRYGRDGAPLGTIARYAGPESLVIDLPGGFGMYPVPFGPRGVAAATPAGVWIGDTGTGEVSLHAADGTVRTTVRSPYAGWPVGRDEIETYVRRRLAAIRDPDRRESREAALRAMTYPATSALIGGVAGDPDGNLWLQEHPHPDAADARWTVFSPEGAVLAEVSMPADAVVLQVGRDFVLMQQSPAGAVATVRRVPLLRS